MTVKHIRLRIKGRVQGVYFRVSAKEKATALGIKGMVRNEQDGSVYAEAEGREEKLKEFEQWCMLGPPGSRVDKVEKEEGPVRGFEAFSIERR